MALALNDPRRMICHLTKKPTHITECSGQIYLPRKQRLINRKGHRFAANEGMNRLSIIWKLDLTDKIKRSFFQAAIVSILLYGCTTWTLAKRLEKKLDGNYTRMLRAILNKSWRQHPTQDTNYTATWLPLRKLSKLDEPDMQDTAGEAGTSS